MKQSVRRIVTKENNEGKAVVVSTDSAAFEKWPGADAGSVVVWSTASVPADNSDGDLEGATRKIGMTLHGGSVFRVTEVRPWISDPHASHSFDRLLLRFVRDGGTHTGWG